MVNATFAYLGTELVGVTAAEAQNPRRSIPKGTSIVSIVTPLFLSWEQVLMYITTAIKLTFFRILIFYCLSVFLVGMIVPYNSPELSFANKQSTGANASPFVVAATLAGVKVLPHIINACILVFVFSASNSDLYIASRTLYGLASDEAAPAIFKRTNKRGVPYPALFLCAAIACLAFMNASTSSTVVGLPYRALSLSLSKKEEVNLVANSSQVFGYFVNLVTIFGILTWISILVTYLFFLRARRAQNIPDSAMPYVAPQGYWGTVVCLFFVILISLTKNYDVFVHTAARKFDYKNFITGYLGIPLYLILLFGHMLVTKSRGVKAHEADFYTGKDIIDAQEAEYVEKEAARVAGSEGIHKFYNRYVAWLF